MIYSFFESLKGCCHCSLLVNVFHLTLIIFYIKFYLYGCIKSPDAGILNTCACFDLKLLDKMFMAMQCRIQD